MSPDRLPLNMNPFSSRLSIRGSLLLGFGAMCVVMLLATLTALYGTAKVSRAIGVILDDRLPTTVQRLQLARATDALAAAGVPLASVTSEEGRTIAFQRLNDALRLVHSSLDSLDPKRSGSAEIRLLADQLEENLWNLRGKVDQRIELGKKKELLRDQLLSNQLAFQQQLAHRIRILEGDNDVVRYLLDQPSVATEQIIELVRHSTQYAPVSRFYTECEKIVGRVLVAIQDPTLTSLSLSRQILLSQFDEAHLVFAKLPGVISGEIDESFIALEQLVLANGGLVFVREQELHLFSESQSLLNENRRVTALIDSATSEFVKDGLKIMQRAGESADKTKEKYLLSLLVVAGCGLLVVAGLLYFYVLRGVILRLTRLSHSMLTIAAGQLDTELPPTGKDELGQLGIAVRKFHQTSLEAELREKELQQKAADLERANQHLQNLSTSDFLTGLANRRRFDDVLERGWNSARRNGQSLALLMLDVDHFKKFNDRYGHLSGDECLKKVASLIDKNVHRSSDLVARYGGEEFAVILADTTIEGAQILAEQIRQAVEDEVLNNPGSAHGVVTVSIGVAVATPDGVKTALDLVSASDKALYQAKSGGRNSVRYASLSGSSCSSPG